MKEAIQSVFNSMNVLALNIKQCLGFFCVCVFSPDHSLNLGEEIIANML